MCPRLPDEKTTRASISSHFSFKLFAPIALSIFPQVVAEASFRPAHAGAARNAQQVPPAKRTSSLFGEPNLPTQAE